MNPCVRTSISSNTGWKLVGYQYERSNAAYSCRELLSALFSLGREYQDVDRAWQKRAFKINNCNFFKRPDYQGVLYTMRESHISPNMAKDGTEYNRNDTILLLGTTWSVLQRNSRALCRWWHYGPGWPTAQDAPAGSWGGNEVMKCGQQIPKLHRFSSYKPYWWGREGIVEHRNYFRHCTGASVSHVLPPGWRVMVASHRTSALVSCEKAYLFKLCTGSENFTQHSQSTLLQ